MAQFVKNDINFHGARSKTRVIESRSSTKNSKNNDDGWGSVPNSKGTSNCGDGWGDIPNDTSVPDDAWGQDRLVSGKAERNRKFRSHNENSSFRVPIQSLPNWDEVDTEFPSLGSKEPPKVNVWERRQQEFEEKKAIVPSSLSEEEKMMQQALELSMMESRQEEERRKQLEDEYRLQTQLLEANPDMFDEFRLSREDFAATAGGFAEKPHKDFKDHSEEFPSDEIVNPVDYGRGWDYSSQETTKEKDLKKGKKKTEPSKQEEMFPQVKQNSGLPPAFPKAGAQPKISKVVEMFGGWGNTKPSTQDIIEKKPGSKSKKWDTVDTNFVSISSKKSEIEDKPASKPTPPVLEVKLENTSNWDAVDTIDLNSASTTKNNNWEEEASVKRNYLGTHDVVELNLKDCEPGYSLNQKDQEFATQSKRKNSKPKVDLKTEVKEKVAFSGKDKKETTTCSEQERDHDLNNEYDRLASGIDEHRSETNNSEQSQGISAKRNVGAKAGVGSKEDKCSDSHRSIESDYALLLSRMDDTHTNAQSEDTNQKGITQIEELEISNKNSQPEISQAPSTFSFDNFLPDLTTGEDHSIPGPKPIKTEAHSSSNPQLDVPNSGPRNTNDINPLYGSEPDSSLPLEVHNASLKDVPSLPIFGGFPMNADRPELSAGNDWASHIEPPKAPEFINPAFLPQPRPMMTPLMNPALMMGMNPMLMQQMMMLSNPFFVQQLQQMDMYYKSLGMPLATGMPLFPQPIPIQAFHNPDLQAFSNSMDVGPGPAAENGTITPPIQAPGSQLPGNGMLDEVPPKVTPPDTDSFWFQDYKYADASPSFIPPPKPTSANAQVDVPPEISAPAFAPLLLNAQNTGNEGIPDHVSDRSSYDGSNRSPEVPYATGWGDTDGESASGWNDGWGDDNASVAKSMRNSSRYVPEKERACRQPASRPSFRRPKT